MEFVRKWGRGSRGNVPRVWHVCVSYVRESWDTGLLDSSIRAVPAARPKWACDVCFSGRHVSERRTCCALQGSACAACVCERGQVVLNWAVPRDSLPEQTRDLGLTLETTSALPGAGRSDVGGDGRPRERLPGSGSRRLGLFSSHVATRQFSTHSALLSPGSRCTYPSPAAQVPPAPPSSPFPCIPTGSDDRGAEVRGGA